MKSNEKSMEKDVIGLVMTRRILHALKLPNFLCWKNENDSGYEGERIFECESVDTIWIKHLFDERE